MALGEEAPIGIFVFVDTHREDRVFGMFVMELLKRWQLNNAGRTPAGPEVQQHDLAAVAGQMQGASFVDNREIGRGFADLLGMSATVAADGHEQERQTEA